MQRTLNLWYCCRCHSRTNNQNCRILNCLHYISWAYDWGDLTWKSVPKTELWAAIAENWSQARLVVWRATFSMLTDTKCARRSCRCVGRETGGSWRHDRKLWLCRITQTEVWYAAIPTIVGRVTTMHWNQRILLQDEHCDVPKPKLRAAIAENGS